MNILHVNAGEVWSGIEARILSLSRVLRTRGYNISLALSPASPLAEKAKRENVPFHPLKMGFKYNPLTAYRLAEILRKNKIHILHTHRSRDHWLGIMAVKEWRLPVKIVRTRHSYTPIQNNFFNRLLYQHLTHKIIAVAEIIRKDMIENNNFLPSHIVTIPSAIDWVRFSSPSPGNRIRDEFKIGNSVVLIGMIGKLNKHKDYPNLLHAASLVGEKVEAKFLIVGEGPLKEELEELTKRLNLGDKVIFAGKREDIPDILSALDLFVLSSSVEGSPAVIKEAMALGVPVVSTNVGGIPEIIEDGKTGILVPPHAPLSLAQAILEAIGNRASSRKRAELAKRIVRERFSEERLAQETEKVYLELAQSNP